MKHIKTVVLNVGSTLLFVIMLEHFEVALGTYVTHLEKGK